MRLTRAVHHEEWKGSRGLGGWQGTSAKSPPAVVAATGASTSIHDDGAVSPAPPAATAAPAVAPVRLAWRPVSVKARAGPSRARTAINTGQSPCRRSMVAPSMAYGRAHVAATAAATLPPPPPPPPPEAAAAPWRCGCGSWRHAAHAKAWASSCRARV